MAAPRRGVDRAHSCWHPDDLGKAVGFEKRLERHVNNIYQPSFALMKKEFAVPAVASSLVASAWAEFEDEIFTVVGAALDRILEDSQIGLAPIESFPGSNADPFAMLRRS